MPKRGGLWIAVAVAAAALALGSIAPTGARAEDAGKQLFTRYCGACHGPGGEGDGILSGLLKVKPKDLTQIAKNNGGKFPTQRVMRFIDGTTDVRAHGNPDMPVWGEVFRESLQDSPAQKAEIRGTILLIVDYIRSIQEK